MIDFFASADLTRCVGWTFKCNGAETKITTIVSRYQHLVTLDDKTAVAMKAQYQRNQPTIQYSNLCTVSSQKQFELGLHGKTPLLLDCQQSNPNPSTVTECDARPVVPASHSLSGSAPSSTRWIINKCYGHWVNLCLFSPPSIFLPGCHGLARIRRSEDEHPCLHVSMAHELRGRGVVEVCD